MNTLELNQGTTFESVQQKLVTAETIVLPSGRDYESCIDSLREEFNIDAPDFPKRVYDQKAGSQMWRIAKGKDVPRRISEGSGDVGLTGTDTLFNQPISVFAECIKIGEWGREDITSGTIMSGTDLSKFRARYWSFGSKLCEFSLMTKPDYVASFRDRLMSTNDGDPIETITSLPLLLGKLSAGLNIQVSDKVIEGKVEGAVDWLAPMAADLVETGDTARANELEIVEPLMDIYSAVFWREKAPFVVEPGQASGW